MCVYVCVFVCVYVCACARAMDGRCMRFQVCRKPSKRLCLCVLDVIMHVCTYVFTHAPVRGGRGPFGLIGGGQDARGMGSAEVCYVEAGQCVERDSLG